MANPLPHTVTWRTLATPDGTQWAVPSTIYASDAVLEPTPAPDCGHVLVPEVVGRFADYQLVRWSECPCRAAAYAAMRAEQARQEAELRERQRRMAWESACRTLDRLFPFGAESRRLAEKTLDTWHPQTAAQQAFARAVRAWLAQVSPEAQATLPPGGLIVGPVGVGKTHLLWALHQAVRSRGVLSAWASVPHLLRDIRRHFDQPGDWQADVTRVFRTVPVLCLDDLGVERPTEWVLEELYVLLDTRYHAQRPLWVTTNWLPDELEARLGPRIVSRLVEMGTIWRLDGPDQRVEQARRRKRGEEGHV